MPQQVYFNIYNNFCFIICRQLLVRLAKELQEREIPSNDTTDEKSGADPVLIGTVNYDDETLPLKEKKSSQ